MEIVGAKEFLAMSGKGIECLDTRRFFGKMLDGPTEKQRATLRKFGVGYSELKCKGQASAVLGVVFARLNDDLATPGQMRALKRIGMTDVSGYTREQANEILTKVRGV